MSTGITNSTYTPTWGRSTLTAVFSSRVAARFIIDDLRAFGLRDDQIGVAMRDPRQQQQFIDDTGTHAADGAANAVVVAAHSILYRLTAGLRSILFPGSPTITAAPALAQVAVAPGGVTGALLSMHMPEAEARQRESDYGRGSVLLTAKVFEDVPEARRIMQGRGGGMVNPVALSTV